MTYRALMSVFAMCWIIAGCQPAPSDLTEEALTDEPPAQEALTDEPTAALAATATPGATATQAPTVEATTDWGWVPTLNPEDFFTSIEGCKFLPPEVGENVVSPLTQPAWTEQVYS